MATPGDQWAGYFYPETYNEVTQQGTLRNRLGERDPDVLAAKEYARTHERQRELLSGEVEIPRTFDAAHVKAIHAHVFQDVYEWAGQYRTVPIFKGAIGGFADVKGGQIDRYLSDVHRLVEATPWERLGRDDFGERAATVFAYLNQAHPFREGNGRTSKVFMEHVAARSSFTLDYDRVTPEQWNDASKWSGPDLLDYEPHPGTLVPVFRAIAADRTTTTLAAVDKTAQTRSLLSASYPRSATEATRPTPHSTPQARRRGPATPGRSQGTDRD